MSEEKEKIELEQAEVTGDTESMKDYEEEISNSFHKLSEGDILKGTILQISDTVVTVDLGIYAEGVILPHELSNDPDFSMHNDIQEGEVVDAMVLREDDGNGNVLLSLRKAADVVAWEKLREWMEEKRLLSIKLTQVVKGGMIAFLEGVRGFVPASQLTVGYVENLEEWIGKTIDALIITVDEDKKRLVLSGKEVEKEKSREEQRQKLNGLQKGFVTTGIVERIEPYGCFVNIGDGMTGLVHISQIAWKRIQSPNEEVKLGQEVKVKVLEVEDGKIRLSIKAVQDRDPVADRAGDTAIEYISGEEATTGLGSLLAGIKLD